MSSVGSVVMGEFGAEGFLAHEVDVKAGIVCKEDAIFCEGFVLGIDTFERRGVFEFFIGNAMRFTGPVGNFLMWVNEPGFFSGLFCHREI